MNIAIYSQFYCMLRDFNDIWKYSMVWKVWISSGLQVSKIFLFLPVNEHNHGSDCTAARDSGISDRKVYHYFK